MTNEKKNGMSMEQIEVCAKELVPVLEQMQAVLEKYGVGKYLSITLTRDGSYTQASGDALGGWELSQYGKGTGWKAKYEFNTTLTLAEEVPDNG